MKCQAYVSLRRHAYMRADVTTVCTIKLDYLGCLYFAPLAIFTQLFPFEVIVVFVKALGTK